MHRRNFLKTTGIGSAFALSGAPALANYIALGNDTWFDRPMRWAQLTLVENDPGRFDPDFWLSYFKRIHADAACLSAGGIVAYYPTKFLFITGATGWAILILSDTCRRVAGK